MFRFGGPGFATTSRQFFFLSFFLAIFLGFSFRFVIWRARVSCTLRARWPLRHITFPELFSSHFREMRRVSCTLRESVGVRTEMKKERNCLDVASNSTMEVLGLTWNKNCMEEVGYYCTGPYLIHSCDKVYLILTHNERINTPINQYNQCRFSYSDCIMARDHG